MNSPSRFTGLSDVDIQNLILKEVRDTHRLLEELNTHGASPANDPKVAIHPQPIVVNTQQGASLLKKFLGSLSFGTMAKELPGRSV